MTTTELNELRGTVRLLAVKSQDKEETIWVPVKVLDSKMSFGHVNLVIEPVGGSGSMTVRLERTKLNNEN